MDDAGFRQQGCQFYAACVVALNDLDGNIVLLQQLGKIIADSSAAAENDAAGFAGNDIQVFKQLCEVFCGGSDEDSIAMAQYKVTAGGDGGAVSQHGANQHTGLDQSGHIAQRNIAKLAVFVDTQLHDLNSALGKGIAAVETGVFQQPLDFDGSLLFWVDGHGQTECIAHFVDLVYVLRIADTRDGVQIGIDAMGGSAAKKIYFVSIGHRDQQICFLHACLQQNGHGGAVAVNGHDIQLFYAVVQDLPVGVNECDIVLFGGKLSGQRGTDFAVACNDNVHRILLLHLVGFNMRPV